MTWDLGQDWRRCGEVDPPSVPCQVLIWCPERANYELAWAHGIGHFTRHRDGTGMLAPCPEFWSELPAPPWWEP